MGFVLLGLMLSKKCVFGVAEAPQEIWVLLACSVIILSGCAQCRAKMDIAWVGFVGVMSADSSPAVDAQPEMDTIAIYGSAIEH